MKRITLSMLAAAGALLQFGCDAGPDMAGQDGSPLRPRRSAGGSEGVEQSQHALIAGPGLVPLVTFYSEAAGDHFTTTQEAWTCKVFRPADCPADPRYRIVGLQGYVHRADRPRPAGTVPLYHWWSPSREDNFLTSDPAWAGVVGDIRLEHDGYRLFRIEGFIPTAEAAGSVPLDSFWNPAVRDNAAVNPRRVSMPVGWGRYRREGYLLGPGAFAGRRCADRVAPDFVDPNPWTAHGNFVNTWAAPADLLDGDALQISAWGQTRIDFWGAHKNVAGEGPAGGDFPAPGEPMFALIGQVSTGRIWVPGKGSYPANAWFPIGAGTGCLEYDAQGTLPGDLKLTINDNNLGDNAGGPSVTVRQWW
jgi:hypothetical protein